MILDKQVELATTVALDLETLRPGPGEPITLWATGVGGDLVFTTGDAVAAADDLITVDAANDVEFYLPSNTKRWIKGTFAAGKVYVVLDAQTNL